MFLPAKLYSIEFSLPWACSVGVNALMSLNPILENCKKNKDYSVLLSNMGQCNKVLHASKTDLTPCHHLYLFSSSNIHICIRISTNAASMATGNSEFPNPEPFNSHIRAFAQTSPSEVGYKINSHCELSTKTGIRPKLFG